MEIFSKSTFELFLIEGIEMYQLLSVTWKNIDPSRNYCRSKVSVLCVIQIVLALRQRFL